MDLLDLTVIFAALFVGGTLKSATGVGLPIVAIPVLTVYFELRFAIAIVVIPTFLSNLWQVWKFRVERPPRFLVNSILVGSTLGVVLGVTILAIVPDKWLNLGVAAIVIVFLISRAYKPGWRFNEHRARILALPASITAGMLQGATGISAPVVITYLSAIDLKKNSFIFSVSLMFLVAGGVQLPAMIAAGMMGTEQLILSGVALVPVISGMWLGEKIGKHISTQLFYRIIMALLVVLTIKLIWSSFS